MEERDGGAADWFGALKDRGYEKGDKLMYAITPDGVRSVVVSAGGKVFVDRVDKGHDGRRVVIAVTSRPRANSASRCSSLVEQKP